MTHSLNQIISLVTFGNEILNERMEPIDFSQKTAFNECKSINYVSSIKKSFIFKPSESLIASNSSDWIEYLKSRKCKELKIHNGNFKNDFFKKGHSLINLDDWRKSWFIETRFDQHSEFYSYRWIANSNDKLNFEVTYGLIKNRKSFENIQYNIEESKNELKLSLNKMINLAETLNQTKWKSQFEFAIEVLNSKVPDSNFYIKDLFPENYLSLSASQLLFSSFESWVFSPHHSSWINLEISDSAQQKRHLNLSIELYDTIKKSIECAINHIK